MGYRAPELACGEFSRKSDIWAIGCIIYRLVAKKNAFPSDEAANKYAADESDDLRPLVDEPSAHSSLCRETFCPEERCMISFIKQIDSIIGSCLARDASARPTAMQLKVRFEAMKRYLLSVL
jgi:serine/threonine protein kinase